MKSRLGLCTPEIRLRAPRVVVRAYQRFGTTAALTLQMVASRSIRRQVRLTFRLNFRGLGGARNM